MKRLFAIASCALLASAVACKKSEPKDDPAATKPAEGAPAPAPASAEAAAPAPSTAPAAPGGATVTATADGATVTATAGGATATATAPGAAPAPTPVEPTADEKALAEKAVAMVEEMATVAGANATDCKKAAVALQAIVDKNKAVIEAGKKMDDDPGKKAWFEQKYQGRMMGSMGKMVPLMEKCKDNPELLKVFTSMQ